MKSKNDVYFISFVVIIAAVTKAIDEPTQAELHFCCTVQELTWE